MVLSINGRPISGDYTIKISNQTFDDFLEFATEDMNAELIDGVVIITPPANTEHETIFKFLLIILEAYSVKYDVGEALGSRLTVKLSDTWGPEPDIIFISKEKRHQLQSTYFDGIPDLIVEILSPSNRDDDLNQKIPKFLELSIPEIWIIDPKHQSVTHHFLDNTGYQTKHLGLEDTIQSSTLEHLIIKVKDIFDPKVSGMSFVRDHHLI